MAEKCAFCGERLERGTGKLIVRKNGNLEWYCTSKCEKNMKLGRSPIKTKWTRTYRKFKGKLTKAEEIKEARAEGDKKEAEGNKKKTPQFKEAAGKDEAKPEKKKEEKKPEEKKAEEPKSEEKK
jgi:large subunit ribosomal protein L24e